MSKPRDRAKFGIKTREVWRRERNSGSVKGRRHIVSVKLQTLPPGDRFRLVIDTYTIGDRPGAHSTGVGCPVKPIWFHPNEWHEISDKVEMALGEELERIEQSTQAIIPKEGNSADHTQPGR